MVHKGKNMFARANANNTGVAEPPPLVVDSTTGGLFRERLMTLTNKWFSEASRAWLDSLSVSLREENKIDAAAALSETRVLIKALDDTLAEVESLRKTFRAYLYRMDDVNVEEIGYATWEKTAQHRYTHALQLDFLKKLADDFHRGARVVETYLTTGAWNACPAEQKQAVAEQYRELRDMHGTEFQTFLFDMAGLADPEVFILARPSESYLQIGKKLEKKLNIQRSGFWIEQLMKREFHRHDDGRRAV
ncbi:unnamed protein product [Amoebophrya sp. A120]|nr:unnamed protein product [Amoebophrya sp. A120]|eukprot:GSA120T00010210001.1